MQKRIFDIIVVGGGHAGIEAAYLASQFNLQIAIITLPEVDIASAPCNPSIGGVAKGQVVREIDSMGGLMGILADASAIHYRTLNASKGFAVQSTRVQIDKERYSQNALNFLDGVRNISIIRQKIKKIEKNSEKGGVFELLGDNNEVFEGKKLVITTGTFLNGRLHCGENQVSGGRHGASSSPGLQDIFSQIKMNLLRFKTGTPPRLHKKSIDFSKMEEQPSDPETRNFHWRNSALSRQLPQVSCHIAHTNPEMMSVIRENKSLSPIFNGQISGIGPRYCPSIEDKANRYPDRDIHHLFIEPEGLNLETIYPNGISTSLPVSIQEIFIRKIKGLEAAKIEIPGYAVEYDVVDTLELNHQLEHKEVEGLYFAGQVNGTSGYEEAAGQGLVAGINAALAILKRPALIFNRHESYIGVMIEDLITNRRDEPYRLFTARSEDRLLLREDNALRRMAPLRLSLGLSHEFDAFIRNHLDEFSLLKSLVLGYREKGVGLGELLKQSLQSVKELEDFCSKMGVNFSNDVIKTLAVEIVYEGHIRRAEELNYKMRNLDSMKISWQDLVASSNISFECRHRIEKIKPITFGQLRMIEGIRQATLAVVAGKYY